MAVWTEYRKCCLESAGWQPQLRDLPSEQREREREREREERKVESMRFDDVLLYYWFGCCRAPLSADTQEELIIGATETGRMCHIFHEIGYNFSFSCMAPEASVWEIPELIIPGPREGAVYQCIRWITHDSQIPWINWAQLRFYFLFPVMT